MELYSRKYGTHSSDLIILHGLFGMSDNWNTLGKKFGESFTVHLIDLRNHGKSPHSTEFNLEVMSQDLLNYINNNNIKEPIILGHSLGGKVAMKFAFLYPDKLRKLIVVDISPRRYDMNFHMKILSTIYKTPLEECNRREDVEDMLSTTIKDKGTRLFLLKNLYRDSNNKFTWKINVEVLLDSLSQIQEFEFNNIKCNTPSFFIRGEHSNYITDPEDIDLIKEHFLDCTFSTILNSGHWVHADNPKQIYQEVIRFCLRN